MPFNKNKCLTDLRNLVLELGQQGGHISPAVYDTAQVLRLAPLTDDGSGTAAWLIAQQHSDGGWGSPAVPCARDLPTLAAMLALRARRNYRGASSAVEAGLVFLRDHASLRWSESLPEDIPAGVEVLLPRLLDEAKAQAIDLPVAPYESLREMGERKRRMIAAMRPVAGTAPTYSWESWGAQSDPEVIDATGGVGHSPAATAAWLAMSNRRDDLDDARLGARQFLKAASAATYGSDLGLVPTIWPIKPFEQIWGLYALFVAGLLDHPYLREVIGVQMLDLRRAMRPDGFSSCDHFISDGDATSVAVAMLIAGGHQVDSRVIYRFQKDDSFICFPNEIFSSLTTNAHAVLGLALAGNDVSRFARYLESKQSPDGRWVGEKWHSSWLYTTAEAVIALAYSDRTQSLPKAVEALLRHQREDGGWGSADRSTQVETAHAALALHTLRSRGVCAGQIQYALEQARRRLADNYTWSPALDDHLWIGKELYSPYRVDLAFVLSVLLALHSTQADW
jgi:squalene-hopene cyclase-like protein/prenyltransferase/squalene oxidase-like repeat protein